LVGIEPGAPLRLRGCHCSGRRRDCSLLLRFGAWTPAQRGAPPPIDDHIDGLLIDGSPKVGAGVGDSFAPRHVLGCQVLEDEARRNTRNVPTVARRSSGSFQLEMAGTLRVVVGLRPAPARLDVGGLERPRQAARREMIDAKASMFGFLIYDLILIGSSIGRFPVVPDANLLSLSLNVFVFGFQCDRCGLAVLVRLGAATVAMLTPRIELPSPR
jgi:hypothetical protein